MKIFDIIFFAYMMDLRLDFQVYLVLIFVIFLFILHTHLTLRSEYVSIVSISSCMSIPPPPHWSCIIGYWLCIWFSSSLIFKCSSLSGGRCCRLIIRVKASFCIICSRLLHCLRIRLCSLLWISMRNIPLLTSKNLINF